MKINTMLIATLGLLSVFSAAGLRAEDAVKEQDKVQARDRLQTGVKAQDKLKTQDKLQEQDKLQAKDQQRLRAGQDPAKAAEGDKKEVKEQAQTRTRGMTGADNAKGQAVREMTDNSGGDTAVKNQEKTASGLNVKAQERKQDKKQLRKKAHSSSDRRDRSERRQGAGASGRRGK